MKAKQPTESGESRSAVTKTTPPQIAAEQTAPEPTRAGSRMTGAFSGSAVEFLEGNFKSKHAGLLYVVELFPSIYHNYLKSLNGKFTLNELSLIVDAFWNQYLHPDMAGEQLAPKVKKAIALNRMDQKWEVDEARILAKISTLPLLERIIIEIWAARAWLKESTGYHHRIPEYARSLAKNEPQ